MKMPEFVTKSCDACGDFFEVEQWFADRSGMQLCDDCAEDMREAAEVMQNGGRA
jgi:predicted nucleic acid-binding Zn ribbon protein